MSLIDLTHNWLSDVG